MYERGGFRALQISMTRSLGLHVSLAYVSKMIDSTTKSRTKAMAHPELTLPIKGPSHASSVLDNEVISDTTDVVLRETKHLRCPGLDSFPGLYIQEVRLKPFSETALCLPQRAVRNNQSGTSSKSTVTRSFSA